ncbi:SRP19 protein [Trichomonas vaginalis G3]|uniref:SRP19 protein n=1 Tax=Trichomonas vaginalis (strain ATCC PRA-98 / G3) TaxID=412133 RepID=A2DEL3_TRIV3|nr:SRP19 protein family [Trichomonas vaginalis G3]EAY21140.1 SRP19 protein [Trichomonas vaginalis G3]KAI5522335.1 SRP19 protein family [Trichomonas vaginalis G3]|eukprot:XP_001582126.1 SRP19 protein [Trichomonas vaginalis G3]
MLRSRIVCYPCYIDSTTKEFDGRKISKELCVEKPTIKELILAFKDCGFTGKEEADKTHPRDFFRSGRVSIDFYSINEETKKKTLLNPNYKNRKSIYAALAAKIKENRANNRTSEVQQPSKKNKKK